ncbi:hypothetical protein EDE12_106167 [Methylosinus sp. sav-2]|uniref:hypothetical protein n=1 Tax=Methylosinus sp. sav-2 TaxID=2485168 RepID=UPI00047AE0A0|nr:hypothetical protein [Methylosinus sp. sav-2]TDX64021.1 hypothetical protein EDE12_106167 [Methylosinus sp. sav-2]
MISEMAPLSSQLVAVERGALQSVLLAFRVEGGDKLALRLSIVDARALLEAVGHVADGRALRSSVKRESEGEAR